MNDGEIEVGGYLTGPGLPVFVTNLEIGGAGTRDQDQLNPYGDDRHFGSDYLEPPIWKMAFCVGEGVGAAEALQALAELQRAWRTAVDPRVPGADTWLRYGAAGRTRRIYGRPRNFMPDVGGNLADGNVVATAEFHAADPYHYDDAEQQLELAFRQNNSGTVTLPAVWPLLSRPGAARQGIVTVGGDAPTPVRVDFAGPIAGPAMRAGQEWELASTATIGATDGLIIDSRTEMVNLASGAPQPGALTRETFLPEVRLEPGLTEIEFTGNDPTGTSKATIRWRNAHHSF